MKEPISADLKSLFAIKHRLAEEIGIGRVPGLLGLGWIGTLYRGIDDVYNLAGILYIPL